MNRRFRELLEFQGYEEYEVTNLLGVYESQTEEQAYNIRKQLDTFFQKIEYREKESLSESMLDVEKKFILYDLRSYSEDSLKNIIMNQHWAEVIPFIEDIIHQLESNHLSDYILKLIAAANIDFDALDDYPLTLFEVATTMRALLIEIRIDSELYNYLSALAKARRCKEILEYAVNIMKVVKDEKLPLVTKSQIQKIDEVNGKSIYKIK